MPTPLPVIVRQAKAGNFIWMIPLMWLGGLSLRAACRRFHWWVWYDE